MIAPFLALLLGCAMPTPPPAEVKDEPLPELKSVGATPVTLRLPRTADVRSVLTDLAADAKAKAALRLTLVGVELPDGAAVGVKVYLNPPDADPLPPADSPHYVGTITGFGPKAKGDYALDLVPVLRKLLAQKLLTAEDALVLRLVAVPLQPAKSVAVPTVKLEGLKLIRP